MDNFTPQSSYTKEELLDCSQGNLFGEKNGRLPTPNMLMFDRIEKINNSEGRYTVSYTHLTLPTNREV